MTVRIRAEGVRLLFIIPRFLLPIGLRAAVRFGGEEMSDSQKALMLALSKAVRKMHWRRYRGLEIVHVSVADGTEVVIKL